MLFAYVVCEDLGRGETGLDNYFIINAKDEDSAKEMMSKELCKYWENFYYEYTPITENGYLASLVKENSFTELEKEEYENIFEFESDRDVFEDELDEYLNGLVITDYIARTEKLEVIEDFHNWYKTANVGDTYCYEDEEFTLEKYNE